MEYKPTKDDIKFAEDVYNNVIWTQVLNPVLIREAHKRLFGFDAITAQQAKIKVASYFMYTHKAVDSTETADINTPSIVGESSHAEDFAKNSESDNQEVKDSPEMGSLTISELEAQYELAETANEKRSIKQKINKLKKANDN